MNPEEPQSPNITDADQPIRPSGQSMDVVPPPENPLPHEQPIQMPPYAPAQPLVTVESLTPDYVAPATPMVEGATHPGKLKKDRLGIISIICVFLGMGLVGFVLGLIGVSRAKKERRSATLSRVGWIVNLVLMLAVIPIAIILVLNNFEKTETKARDIERAEDLGSIEAKLEEYFANNFGYPSDLDELDISDRKVLIGPNGSTIKLNDVAADEEEAKDSTNPTSDIEYTYTPYGKPTCITTCDGYVLKAFIENPEKGVTNPLVKLGLENL